MEKKYQIDWVLIAVLLAMFILVLFLWNFVLIYPIKLFVVLLHELSHGLAAVITGGSIHHIEISQQLGGVCYTSGGWQLLILPAGYLGSIFWGGLILVLSARTKTDKTLSIIIGAIILIVTVLYVRPFISFGTLFGSLFGGLMILIGLFAPTTVNDLLLKFIGLTSMLYAIIDIKEDLISRTIPGSDAYAFSQIIPLPPVVWGIIWGLLAIVGAFFVLRIAARKKEKFY